MAQDVTLHAIAVTQWLALLKEYVKRVRRVQPATGQGKKQNVNVSNVLYNSSVYFPSWHGSSLLRRSSP